MNDLIKMINFYREAKGINDKSLLEVAVDMIYIPALISDFWIQYLKKMEDWKHTEAECRQKLEEILQKKLETSEDNKGIVWTWRLNTGH